MARATWCVNIKQFYLQIFKENVEQKDGPDLKVKLYNNEYLSRLINSSSYVPIDYIRMLKRYRAWFPIHYKVI